MELRPIPAADWADWYENELCTTFPDCECKPLADILSLAEAGRYEVLGLYDGPDLLGYAALWSAPDWPGCVLLDYLGVTAARRNGGLGSVILEKLRETEGDTVIFGESEIPQYAPDPAMAERRLGFYARSGAHTAGYDTEMFGVPYKTLYWAAGDVDEAALMEEHRFVYASTFAPDKFARYVRIPFDPQAGPGKKVEWQQ